MTSQFLSTTVVVAIGLFFIREIFEATRRILTRRRRLNAIQHLLKIECERANWAVKRLTRIIKGILSEPDDEQVEYTIVRSSEGRVAFRADRSEHNFGQSQLPSFGATSLDRYILELAGLNRKTFQLTVLAYDAIIEVEHVRNSLVQLIEERDTVHLKGFCDYALSVLSDSFGKLDALYKHCAGQPLTIARVR